MSKSGCVRWLAMRRACIAAFLVLTCTSQSSAGDAPTPDVNRDGIVSAIDVAMVGRCLGQHPHNANCANADVDHDGDIDVIDLHLVIRSLRTRQPTATETATPLHRTATATATATPVIVPSNTPQPTAIPTPTVTNSPVPSVTGTTTPTVTQTASPSHTSTGTPTATLTVTRTPTGTITRTHTSLPTLTQLPTLTHTATTAPTNTPIHTFTQTPTSTVDVELPPDPAAVAPPVDQSVVITMQTATAFLYTGANPIQTGVAPGTIDAQRAAVVRGNVMDRNDAPLAGVRITILNHPEFGQTLTRADGMFDLAVNGGGQLTVNYDKTGLLPAQRQVYAAWGDYGFAPDVVLIALDPQVTIVDLTANVPIQVARGSVVTDADGTRQATVLVPQGTTALMVLPGGGTQPVSTLSIRATEYTVGANGPEAMPAQLPPTSSYTYAVELSADEAIAAGATELRFSTPLPFYVDNFLGFPVGVAVPLGTYDPLRGLWIPENSGRVIAIVGITGGMADIDIDGNGMADGPAALATLSISDPERQQLASLYQPGRSLWRVLIPHFSTEDLNWPTEIPSDAIQAERDPEPDVQPEESCQTAGSIIDCQSQILGEVVDVPGTPFRLHYQSDRVPGQKVPYTVEIPLSGAQVPASLHEIELDVRVAGRRFQRTFPRFANQRTTFTWDGRDAYGRTLQGEQPLTVRIGYSYVPVFASTVQFSDFPTAVMGGISGRERVIIWREWTDQIGSWDARAVGLGGWTLSPHHTFDLTAKPQALYRGDGRRQSSEAFGPFINRVAGGTTFCAGTTGTIQNVCPQGLATGDDGSVYITQPISNLVQRMMPNGVIQAVPGVASRAGAQPYALAVGPDGSLYVTELFGHRVRKVDPSGTVTNFAGTGVAGFSGDGGPANLAQLNGPVSIAVGPDGVVYIADANNARIRRVTPDGRIATAVGTGQPCTSTAAPCGDGGPAALAPLLDVGMHVAVGRDGSLYIAGGQRVRYVGPDGIITTIAGVMSTQSCSGTAACGDGGPATQALLAPVVGPNGFAVGPDDTIYYAQNRVRIRWFRRNGTINTLAGNGLGGDGGLAWQAGLQGVNGIAVARDGSVYVAETALQGGGGRLRRISPIAAGNWTGGFLAPASDGSEVYLFDPEGRHLRTVDALTAALRNEFSYDGNGLLASITDGDGNITSIERDGAGNPTAIVAPFGQRTTLTINRAGYLDSITQPTGATVHMTYTTDGLLDSMTNARGHLSQYGFDPLGRLTSATDPTTVTKTLTRVGTNDDYTVTLTTPLGRTTTYRVERLGTGDVRLTTTSAAAGQIQAVLGKNGTRSITHPDGTTVSAVLGPDPRWRMQAPVVTSMAVRTPGGLAYTYASQRLATLTNPTDLLSLSTLTETVTVNGRVFTRAFNAGTRAITDSSPAGRRDITILNARGWPAQAQFGGIAPTDFVYDLQGRLARITQATGTEIRTTAFAYTGNGFLRSITDPANHTATYSHDQNGRITELTLPDGARAGLGYDANGNLSTLTPPGRPDHSFTYTENNQPSGYIAPMVGTQPSQTLASYDVDRLPTRVDRADGQSRSFEYDTAGRLSLIDMAVGDTRYGYDGAGRLVTLNRDQGANLSFAYDGDLLLGTTWSGAIGGSVTRAYDNNFRTTALSVNGSNPIALTYDLDGLPMQVGALTLTRNAQNALVTATALGSVTDTTTYDAFAAPATHTAIQGGNALYSTTYTRDALGRIATKSEIIAGISHTFSYTYDPAGRLIEVWQDGNLTSVYTYDGNGNRLSRTIGSETTIATYDAQDRLDQFGATTYVHNAAGERESQTTAGETTNYQYDGLGDLIGVTLPDATQIEYVLDGLKRRVGRKIDGTLVQAFLYQDDLKPIAELDGGNNVVSRFVYSDGINVPAYMIRSGVTYRIVTDHLGSPRLVIDAASGSILQQMDYDELGAVMLDTNPGFQPFGFAGGIYDSQTGLVHFGAREYDPVSSRWTTKDPLGFGGGDTNLQTYVRGDPINGIDPRGLFCDGGFTCGILRDETELLEGRMSLEDYRDRQVARAAGGAAGVVAVIGVLTGAAIYEGLASAVNSLGAWVASKWAACTTTSATATAIARDDRIRQRLAELAAREAANIERLSKLWQASQDKFNAIKVVNPGDVAGTVTRLGGR